MARVGTNPVDLGCRRFKLSATQLIPLDHWLDHSKMCRNLMLGSCEQLYLLLPQQKQQVLLVLVELEAVPCGMLQHTPGDPEEDFALAERLPAVGLLVLLLVELGLLLLMLEGHPVAHLPHLLVH